MRQASVRLLSIAAFSALAVSPLAAQQPAAPATPVGPAVGTAAPDFEFKGITRYGALGTRQKLSDFRGKTVVLAFFPKARTKG